MEPKDYTVTKIEGEYAYLRAEGGAYHARAYGKMCSLRIDGMTVNFSDRLQAYSANARFT